MPLFASIPLTLVPLLVYNVIAFDFFGAGTGDPWQAPIFTIDMVSDARFTMVLGDLMIVAALFLLFVEMLKATRTGIASLMDHILSMLVFVAYLVEFLIVPQAAASVFFILMAISLIDVIAGFSITITAARRDVSLSHGEHM